MKKSSLFIMTAILSVLTLGCTSNKDSQENSADTTACVQDSTLAASAAKTTLVAYFSATGTTAKLAQKVATAADADLFEIKPETPYTEADLDWRNDKSRTSVEMKDKTSRPAIANKVDNWDQYETIYIGFPIWWYTAPTIINTFLEQYPLSGKTIIPFATSGGSSIDKACEDLKAAYPTATWKAGFTNPSDEEIPNLVK